MKRRTKSRKISFLTVLFMLGLMLSVSSGCATRVVVKDGPPAVRVEKRGAKPGPAYVWVGGYWQNKRGRWVWASGKWVRPPRAKNTWVPGHWKKTRGGWTWVPGHWR